MSGQPPPYQAVKGYYEGQGVPAPTQPYNQPPHPGYNPNYQNNPKQPINHPPHHHHHHHPPNYGSGYQQTTIIQSVPVVVVGGCPACRSCAMCNDMTFFNSRVGVLEDDFTCLGVCCAIAFFPIGLLCCLAMKQRRCPNCGAIFG